MTIKVTNHYKKDADYDIDNTRWHEVIKECETFARDYSRELGRGNMNNVWVIHPRTPFKIRKAWEAHNVTPDDFVFTMTLESETCGDKYFTVELIQ